ncbi:MAG: hypothetical protein JWP63_3969 [Candidatus Solibacter sp.]|nr:hypothetical protein [Candidatus Solibacter sp.]
MTRRDWITMIAASPAAAPLLRGAEPPAAPVAIAKCASYDEDVTAKMGAMFDQLGGLDKLVRNKTVTIKVNMTGAPSQRFQGLALGLTHYTHPKVVGATAYLLGRAGAKRIRFVESPWATTAPLEDVILDSGWNLRALQAAAPGVEFENTNALCKRKKYARFKFPGRALMYPEYVMSQAYEETDVFVSLAKLKNHADCGVTLSLKNCFGNVPASIYGDDAGVDDPNESPKSGRAAVVHFGKREPAKIAPACLENASRQPGITNTAGYRVSRVVADLAVVRPIHLQIIDGVESTAGGEGPWIRGVRVVKPGMLIAGLNPVCTDAVATAAMGYNPRATRGTAPFAKSDNTLLLAEQHGVGTTDLKRIDVRGVSIEQALYRYDSL